MRIPFIAVHFAVVVRLSGKRCGRKDLMFMWKEKFPKIAFITILYPFKIRKILLGNPQHKSVKNLLQLETFNRKVSVGKKNHNLWSKRLNRKKNLFFVMIILLHLRLQKGCEVLRKNNWKKELLMLRDLHVIQF